MTRVERNRTYTSDEAHHALATVGRQIDNLNDALKGLPVSATDRRMEIIEELKMLADDILFLSKFL